MQASDHRAQIEVQVQIVPNMNTSLSQGLRSPHNMQLQQHAGCDSPNVPPVRWVLLLPRYDAQKSICLLIWIGLDMLLHW
jgi:hypothetical protein